MTDTALIHLRTLIPSNGRSRRASLNEEMARREALGLHCFACTGVCCTFVANSMKTTPLETAEVLLWLEEEHRWNETLREELRATVSRFRLDKCLNEGRRPLRRTYTCTFYAGGSRGCTLSRSIKPYGCLSFNPQRPNQTEGGDCHTDLNQLATREANHPEEQQLNEQLKERYGLDWETLPLPLALLELHEKLNLPAG